MEHKRVSATKQEENRDYPNRPIPMRPLPRRPQADQQDQQRMLNPEWMSTTHSTHVPMNAPETTEQFEPTFVKLDRQVLRFYGYAKEPVVESRMEHFRVKRLILYYYLEDNTLSIIEPREENAGKPQGAFLKRRMVLKQNASGIAILPEDLVVGQEILIYGNLIYLCDCDAYTREFYEYNQRPQPAAEDIPVDRFTLTNNAPRHVVKDTVMKDFLEKALGGGKPKPQRQFLDHDRQVLRFYAKSGDKFVVHYYLADDTIEILEVRFANNGKDNAPVFLRRSKMPKRLAVGQPGQVPLSEFVTEKEFFPDMTLTAYGRDFQILAADSFTVEYFKRNYQRTFPVGPVIDPAPLERTNVIIPPHDGLGSEEDSLGYIYRLIPKPPYKDFFKFIDNSSKILRWVAHLNTTIPEDVDRRFIISYFLHDDSLQIHEIPQRNSGIAEGKFLIRNRYKNVQNNEVFFGPHDFVIGRDVLVNSYSFHLESCDEFTRKYMEATYGLS